MHCVSEFLSESSQYCLTHCMCYTDGQPSDLSIDTEKMKAKKGKMRRRKKKEKTDTKKMAEGNIS